MRRPAWSRSVTKSVRKWVIVLPVLLRAGADGVVGLGWPLPGALHTGRRCAGVKTTAVAYVGMPIRAAPAAARRWRGPAPTTTS